VPEHDLDQTVRGQDKDLEAFREAFSHLDKPSSQEGTSMNTNVTLASKLLIWGASALFFVSYAAEVLAKSNM
jgi:hypothetical protein